MVQRNSGTMRLVGTELGEDNAYALPEKDMELTYNTHITYITPYQGLPSVIQLWFLYHPVLGRKSTRSESERGSG